MSIKIEKVSYNNSKDRQVLKTILSKWFENPKELNWTDPRLNYPFNFNRWVELTYKDNNVKSFVLKEDKWVIGIGNIILNKNTKFAHALHIFIDSKYRNKGLGTKMLQYLEALAKDVNMITISINVMPKNKSALKLYEKMGFKKLKSNGEQGLQLQKSLV
jgi:ribosomal protein S18 acetylase RimI-like enzyme|tara:strand:- start:791 stop:1270 length:480 start_codon:yes stop_codon:yes gene_type:complete